MVRSKRMLTMTGAVCALLAAEAARAAPNKVVIGDIDDMSGPYADVIGAGGVEAIKMAIADFGGTVLGQPIEVLTADHQNKPDIGRQKFREWADTAGLTMLLGGSNTGVSLAMSVSRQGEEHSVFRHRRRWSFADRQGLHALHDTLRLRHDGARQRHGEDDPRPGRQELVLPHCGLCFRDTARERSRQRRQGERRLRRRRRARASRHLRFCLLSPAGAGIRCTGARPR